MYTPTKPDSEVFRRNEDAVQFANRCAGDLTCMVERLRACESPDEAAKAVKIAQDIYQAAFDAFIYGVDYGRKYPNG